MRAIELVLGYGCDCRCRFCPGLRSGDSREMDVREIVSWLHFGRGCGATIAILGGGEPTLNRHFLRACRAARDLGYHTVEVATSCIAFADAVFTKAAQAAGANLVSFGLTAAREDVHDGLAGRPGALRLAFQGLSNVLSSGIDVRAEILITRASAAHLSETVESLAGRGVTHFRFWLVSLHGLPAAETAVLLPRLEDVKPRLQEAFDVASRLAVDASCLHVPPCVLDHPYRDRYRHAGHLGLVVVTPGERPFAVEESPIEGGRFLSACEACVERPRCLGLRTDYLEAFPGTLVTPIPPPPSAEPSHGHEDRP